MIELLIICVAVIGVLLLDIKAVSKNPYIHIKLIGMILFILSIFRYVTLLLFANGGDIGLLEKMSYFYFITSMGITIPCFLALWYITPFYREKINSIGILLITIPWFVFYILMCVFRPFKIIKSPIIGYSLTLTGKWALYLSMMQGFFIFIFIIATIYGFTLYKHKQIRSQYFVLIISQLLLLQDGFSYFGLGSPVIPVFTVTEGLCFLGLYYSFIKPPIDARGIYR